MEPSTWWWTAAALAVAAELVTGTFYLLMLALGLVAAALAAHLQASPALQLLAAALVGGGAVALWTLRRRRHTALQTRAEADPDVNPDIGQHVHVTHWAADGSTHVSYRGASWSARWRDGPGALPAIPGNYVIRAVEGSQLLLGH
ncbi:MAG: hypothetical protein RLY71_1093 [Pseudomonadota bacterium]|jgi:membrane protein implicated in regulation of membrane protease activity